MASSIEDFEDILSGEPFSGQDMAKLRAASYHGIPAACRAKVWLLLLQATQKVTNFYSQQNTDPTTKRLRAEVNGTSEAAGLVTILVAIRLLLPLPRPPIAQVRHSVGRPIVQTINTILPSAPVSNLPYRISYLFILM